MSAKKFAPRPPVLWNILASRRLILPDILKELVDNALSANAGDVAVYLRQEDWHQYQLEVIDNGEGIAEERLSEVFGCGRAKPQKLGRYNRFGIGLKTVLVNCAPKGKAWEMITKTENGTALRVAAPYRDSVMQYEAVSLDELPHMMRTSGTKVSVPLPHELVDQNCRDSRELEMRIERMMEELRVTYLPVLLGETDCGGGPQRQKIHFFWKPLNGRTRMYNLTGLEPIWTDNSREDEAHFLLNGVSVHASYRYGEIEPTRGNYHYYLGDRWSGGLMVYLNGRLLRHGLFDEIWKAEVLMRNTFLFVLYLQAEPEEAAQLDFLDGSMQNTDPYWHELLRWVCCVCPEPQLYIRHPFPEWKEVIISQLEERLHQSNGVKSMQKNPREFYGMIDSQTIYVHLKNGRTMVIIYYPIAEYWFDVAKIGMFCLTATGNGLHFDELIVITDEQSEPIKRKLALLRDYWYQDIPQPKIRLVHWASVLSDEEEEDEA